jgi:hypothetical protein
MHAIAIPPAGLDLFVQWEPSSTSVAAFHSGLDLETRTVRVMGAGVWHEDDAALYFDQQRRIIDEARRRFGPLRVFFDVRSWIVENEQSALQFQHMNAEIYRPEDRLVAVVNASVDKKHPRVALGVGTREAFVSMNAAETWLQAYSIG